MKFYHVGLCATGLENPNGMQRALLKVFPDYREISTGRRRLNDNIVFDCTDAVPEVVFVQVQTANIVHLDTLRWLKARGCFIVNWTGDVRVPLPQWYLDWAAVIDLSLFTNETDVATVRAAGFRADFLDIGIDPTIYAPEGPRRAVPEVVFMANDYGDLFGNGNAGLRRQVVSALQKHLGPRFGVFGNGWPGATGNLNGSQAEEAAAYRGAKLAINISHYDLERYSSDRLLRIMGAGCLALTHAFPGLQKDYADGRHLRVWYTLEQLGQLIDHYLVNGGERQAIAAEGCAHVHRTRTFDRMAENLKELILRYKT